MSFRLTAVLLAALLAACSDASMKFPVTGSDQASLSSDVQIVHLTDANIGNFDRPKAAASATSLPPYTPGEYRIGAGDVISIFLFDHPELAIPTTGNAVSTGFQVQSDGSLTYPFIGSVTAKGRTVEELRADLAQRLGKYFPDPQVDVRIIAFTSQRVVVGGEVRSPNTQSIQSTPLTLLEAINAAGGLTEKADARAITLRRAGANHRVDLDGFLVAGLSANNPALKGGDVISVPRKPLREAYLLGEVQKPATIDLSQDPITLTQAITRQGGLNEARADARGVFVFREIAGKMTVYQLDTSLPTALLLGTRFTLEPMDVVYVTKSPLQRWNDTISRLLPSVTAINTAQAL